MTRTLSLLILITVGLTGLTGLTETSIAAATGAPATPSSPSTGPTRTPKRPPTRCTPVDRKASAAPAVFKYGLSGSTLQSDFYGKPDAANDGSYNDSGYRPVRLTGYVDDGQVRFATKWVKAGGPKWTSRFGMTGAEFHARYLAQKDSHLIVDASGYNTPAGIRYADIWVQSTGLRGAVTRDVPADQMDGLALVMRADGLAPTRIEGYASEDHTPLFIVTWVESACDWAMDQEMTGAQYQAFADAHAVTMRPVHVDSYMSGSQVRFASIFWKQKGPVFRATHGQHWYGFQASLNHDSCDGYSLDNFYGMELPDGWHAFGGIWSYAGKPSVKATSSLATRVSYHVNCATGRAGAALINVTTGETVLSHADQWFGTASACKAWVLLALLRKADAEAVDLDSTEVDGKTLTTLATEMIVNSNNTSTNTLIDYVGMDAVNDELEALGLEVSRLRRYLTGGASAHGLGSWFDDFKAGWDNFSTPRELATFWRLIYENDGLLSADAYGRFLAITGTAPTVANDVLDPGYDPSSVIYFNKAGAKTYTGIPGDFAHRPQLGTHRVNSEGGVMSFVNGNLVFYAVIVDERDPDTTAPAISCVGWEAAKQWGGGNPGNGAGQCIYP